ncbi:MAG: hypothetical protein KatS3mg124_0753 [Porticoccaceae bacterium]|nr:MAG: hypothetical protein KatS3mg124_0753 [Porticoccaceae bacterium]
MPRHALRFCLLLCALLLGAALCHAAEEPFRARVAVADYGPAERERALREGLAEVLVRLAGQRAVLERADVQKLLAEAPRLALRVGYATLPDGGQALEVVYNGAAVEAAMRRARLPLWPLHGRPALVAWLVVGDAASQPTFATPDAEPALWRLLREGFERRGVPFLTPLFDLEEQWLLPPEGAWALDGEAAARAADRYGAGHWLLLRAYRSGAEQWRLAWRVGSGEEAGEIAVREVADLAAGVAAVVDAVADELGARYAYVPSAEQIVEVEVAGVADYASWRELTALLARLTTVRGHRLRAVEGDRCWLELRIDGAREALLAELAADGRLAVADATASPLRLYWRGAPR